MATKVVSYTLPQIPGQPRDTRFNVLFQRIADDVTALYAAEGRASVKTVYANYSVLPIDRYIFVNATAGAITILVPLAAAMLTPVVIKKIDSSANAVTVSAQAGQTIDGGTITLAAQYNVTRLISDQSAVWYTW